MSSHKELLKVFKQAPWASEPEAEQWVEASAPIPLELADFIEHVASKASLADAQGHAKRCAVLTQLLQQRKEPSLFKPLVKLLKSGPPELRRHVAQWVPLANSLAEHEDLVALLREREPEVRMAAAEALKKVGGKTVMQMLGQAVREPGYVGMREALDAVTAIAGHHAIPVLQVALGSPDVSARALAIRYLGDPGFMARNPAAALQALLPALRDPAESVATAAITAFCTLCTEDDYFNCIAPSLDGEKPKVVIAAVEGMKRFSSVRVCLALERKLASGPLAVRLAVLTCLESMGSDDAMSPLIAALGHRQLQVRTRAGEVMSALSRQGRIDLARAVIWLLRRPDPQLRRLAADLMRSIHDATGEVWPKLLTFLKDEDWWVREHVMDALVELAGRDMTRYMVAWLAEPSALVRRFALTVLARLKDPASVGALVRTAMTDTDWWAREQAIEAIAAVNDPRTPPYLIDLASRQPDLTVACLMALHAMNAQQALPHIVGYVTSQDIDVRFAALRCVEKFGQPISPDLVRPLLQDASPALRMLARELLLRWNVSAQLDAGTGASFLDSFLVAMANAKGDDLIVSSNRRIIMKRMGEVVPVNETPLSPDQVQALLVPLLNAQQLDEIEKRRDVDLSYVVKSADLRYRVNVFRQHEGLGAVFRIIRSALPEIEKLGLPQAVLDFAQYPHGLVLIGGPTGSGKSTTMAALIDYMNRTMARHIISLEDPIEVVHKRKQSLVNQRELGTHTKDLHAALRSALREDPDVLLVGEMRDLETIAFAVTAAETGHLVFGTVHTVSADSSIDRIINTFPGAQQDQVRSMLADSLRAVLCQYLVKRRDSGGRCLASEVMLNNDAISNLIRKGKCFQIPSVIATSKEQGMQSMDADLMRLFRAGVADRDDVYMKARNKRDFEELFPELKQQMQQQMQGTPGTSSASSASGASGASGVSTKSPAAPARPTTSG